MIESKEGGGGGVKRLIYDLLLWIDTRSALASRITRLGPNPLSAFLFYFVKGERTSVKQVRLSQFTNLLSNVTTF